MKWLLALLLVSCQPVVAETVTPTPQVVYVTPAPTPVPTVAPTPAPFVYPTLDPRRLVVSISATAGAQERGRLVAESLPTMWRHATKGRSEVTLLSHSELAPVFLVVLDDQVGVNGTNVRGHTQWLAGERIRLVNIYRPADNLQLMRVVLHELGHALGCCQGPEADAGRHWLACGDELMCHKPGQSLIFSERELRQMGL